MIRSLACLLVLFLSGCSSLPASHDNTWLWQLSGRAVFQGPDQRESANILWQSAARRDSVQLSGPFGQGAVRLIADSTGASLWRDGEIQASDIDIESLLTQHLHWQVPIKELRAWVRGDNAPGDIHVLEESAQRRRFEQAGWVIEQSKLDPEGRPHKVVIARPPYKLTLLIAQWNS
ncbi:MAG TPA: outer membrane lipoprotein LolB [Pseudomonadales bacterium]|nr:outer membrane lipoprotein LolB [Pseudomonadales bacterium]